MYEKTYAHIKPTGRYRSQYEAAIASQLKTNGIAFGHETTSIPYILPYEPYRTYHPDFSVFRKDGKLVFLEAKGWMKSADAQKMVYVRRQNPDLDIRMVFQSGKTKVGRLKSTGPAWAKHLGYPAAVTTIPDE
jgi:hypothetical protein